MINISCINLKTGQKFGKQFTSPYLARNFIRKCSYSTRIKVIDVNADTTEELAAVISNY